MRRTVDRPDLREALADGEVTFDRVEALSRIPEDVGLLEHLDVAGVRREAANRVRITAEDEYRTADDRFLVLQPSLDESWWKGWFGLDGATGALVDKILSEKADELPLLPDGTRGDSSWRKAIALAELCVTDDPPPAQVTVFVDATHAAPSNGQAGVVLEAGPRIGRDALQAILCDAVTEVTARRGRRHPHGLRAENQNHPTRPATGDHPPRRQTPAPATAVQAPTDSKSTTSSPGQQGGTTDPDNLITLCWFHHQIVVHQQGFQPYHHPEHGRIRFRRVASRVPPDLVV